MMKLVIATTAFLGLTACLDQVAPTEPETSDTTQEIAAEQICCNNISGWGSVVYYQSWTGYGWTTGDTFYHQGGSCPGTSGGCTRVNPIQ